ncbi:CD209 antigen-like protein A isoform X2 [Sitophilus oryzae]|uniref:CD209 antigen-like protein A isoform X2 n=1 Tax=Sitophilus oryzae TaxID=7048 RepID=A0A6J2XKL8_SITOR|nr:CD209 antigen-like protein A isoform X2 [Sitophilus oryzae]
MLNWTAAREACINADLELASVLLNQEHNAIEKFLLEHIKKEEDIWSGYWLAGIRHHSGSFYWDNTGIKVGLGGLPPRDYHVKLWLLGEPNNVSGMEHCLELKWDGIFSGWNDISCSKRRRYICQSTREGGLREKDSEDYSYLAFPNALNQQVNCGCH